MGKLVLCVALAGLVAGCAEFALRFAPDTTRQAETVEAGPAAADEPEEDGFFGDGPLGAGDLLGGDDSGGGGVGGADAGGGDPGGDDGGGLF